MYPIREDVKLEPKSFDYVIETFGLCSYEDPVQVMIHKFSILAFLYLCSRSWL